MLLLHGGPGLPHGYMAAVALELQDGYRVASFQQRGLPPSLIDGPFTMAQAIGDVVSVLDALDWSQAFLVGHSWGGHLAFRVAAAHPDRLLGMLAIDPLGVVGDGGIEAFEAELRGRTPKHLRDRLAELEQKEQAARLSNEEQDEFQSIVWPAYFADPENVMPRPPTVFCDEAFAGLSAEVSNGTEEVVASLGRGLVPYGVVAGAGSPFPWGQVARRNAELSPAAFLTVIPNAGHFVWHESPGSVRAALDHLADQPRGPSPD